VEKRKLGSSDLAVAPLAFGGNVFGWTADEATSFALLDAFVEGGFNLIDTADVYSRWVPGHQGGESEAIIGNWLARRGGRDKVVIATKVGLEMGPGRKGLRRDYILSSAEASLRRLKTDYIDLYQAHADDPSTPFEETLEAFARLIAEGKVRAIGASNIAAGRLAAALETSDRLGLPRYVSVQPPYNLCERATFEGDLEALCLKEGLGAIPYYGLASGFLTGKYRAERDLGQSARGAAVRKYLNERGFRILAALDEVAARYASTPAAVALAWAMARPGVTAPIASATSLAQWRDLAAAATLTLDRPAMDRLEAASR
jgi:aryl-alcohol dehydrogenase-like predicted oxidoreductase